MSRGRKVSAIDDMCEDVDDGMACVYDLPSDYRPGAMFEDS